MLTRAEFVDEVFYNSGYAIGAQVVGFNLPFDISRLAIRHSSARRGMRGGFEEKAEADRGYFIDVKTLAAALTSKSHSLESLSELLKVPTPKEPSDMRSTAAH